MERRPKVRIEVKKEEAEFVEEVDSDEGESEGSRTEGESEKSTGDKKGKPDTH